MPRQEYRFVIDTFTPESIPMARLAEYMAGIAKMLGNEERVHFLTMEAGSVAIRNYVEETAVPKVTARLKGIRNNTAPSEAIDAYAEIDRRLAEDNAIGIIETMTEGRIIEFPGRARNRQQVFGAFVQPGTLDGTLIRVGGRDATVPVYLQEGSTIHHCNANRDVAKKLAPHIYGDPLRVHGSGRWFRDGFGNWTMDRFTINHFDVLQQSTLRDAIDKLRSIPDGVQILDDPVEELRRIRHGDPGRSPFDAELSSILLPSRGRSSVTQNFGHESRYSARTATGLSGTRNVRRGNHQLPRTVGHMAYQDPRRPTEHTKERIESDWLTLKEVAAMFGCTPRAVRFRIKAGTLRAEKVGVMWLVRREWAEGAR